MDIDIEQIKQLMRALRRHDLTELDIRQGDQRITLRRELTGGRGTGTGVHPGGAGEEPAFPLATAGRAAATGLSASPVAIPAAGVGDDPSLVTVPAELVGTFYRSASPGSRPFAEVGSTVHKGSVLCIIEAMKLMNEIESEVDGTVVEVLVENGRPVEFGEPLFRIRRSG